MAFLEPILYASKLDWKIDGLERAAVLQVWLEYNDNKEWLKASWIIGRLVVYWVGVIMRLILIEMIFI